MQPVSGALIRAPDARAKLGASPNWRHKHTYVASVAEEAEGIKRGIHPRAIIGCMMGRQGGSRQVSPFGSSRRQFLEVCPACSYPGL